MPPRKIKRDPEAVKIAAKLEDPINALLEDLDETLKKIAVQTARNETARVLSMIPKEIQEMNLMDFLNGPPVELFTLKEESIEEEQEGETDEEVEVVAEKENQKQPEHQESPVKLVESSAELDDASHETSIPIVHSAQNSGRNTATERLELITPAGHVLPVPHTIYPKIDANSTKPFRLPHLDEEIAFSVNGSPMVVQGAKKGSHDKRTTSEKGLLKPKLERESGTAV